MREAFILVTYFNELNKLYTVCFRPKTFLCQQNPRLRADGFCTPRFLIYFFLFVTIKRVL